MSINETLPALDLTQSGGQILNYQNTFDRVCDEIRMKIDRKFLRNPTFNLNEIAYCWGIGDRT
jgi:hypothetical protein